MTTRRGFTLVELLIGLILMLAVGAVTYQLLVNTQRVNRSQSEHIGMQDNGRSGALIVANELREVGYDQITAAGPVDHQLDPGISAGGGHQLRPACVGPDSIIYRAMRGLGYTCQLSGARTISLSSTRRRCPPVAGVADAHHHRQPDALHRERPTISGDDLWLTVGLTTAPVAQTCADGSAGIRFRIGIPAGLRITSRPPSGATSGSVAPCGPSS